MVPALVGRDPPARRRPPAGGGHRAGAFRRDEREHGGAPAMTPAETAVRDAFAAQAKACAERGSPFTGLLCEALGHSLDRSTEVGRRVLDWPGRPDARGDSVPLRLAAGLHALVRRGRVPRLAALYPPNSPPEAEALRVALAEAVADAEADLLPWLDLPPQTNEPMRSGPLMAGLLAVAAETGGLPLALHEIGASAGLVLVLDRYGHRLGCATAGTPVTHAGPERITPGGRARRARGACRSSRPGAARPGPQARAPGPPPLARGTAPGPRAPRRPCPEGRRAPGPRSRRR